ncbi:MAG: DMT family transporter [Ruminiclostridium sp.]|nr:DMT family transporter [Ruminiclostridium sp.]
MTYAFVILPVIFWGISFISTKVVLQEIPPVSIAFFRQLIALIPLIIWVLATKTSLCIKPRDLLLLAGSCFFGIVLYFIFENNGLLLTTASSAAMIVSAVPIFTLVSEALLFKMKVNLKIILCILTSIAGVYLVISVNGKLDFSSATFLGNLLIMGAMISWVIFTILSRRLGNRYVSLVITTYQAALSSILFIPFIIPEIQSWKPVTPVPLLNLIYLGVFCSALSYFSFLYAVKRLGPTVSSAFLNLIPVVAVITGFLILGEKLALIQYFGMALIMLSLFKLGRDQQKAG